MANNMRKRSSELSGKRVPFVEATVVRAQCPTSVRPGDAATILGDGTITGFVGGHCAETSVRTAALQVLDSGEALLLRILPEDNTEFPESPGSLTVVNPCLSGGALEIFLEPKIPAPLLVVVGDTPIAEAVAIVASPLGFSIEQPNASELSVDGATAVIISTHGHHEPESIRNALDAGVGFIGLVASHIRGTAVLDDLSLTEEELGRVRTPVGIDIGAKTAEEIALSIVAEIVQEIRLGGLATPTPGENIRPLEVVDPICGMTVTVQVDTPHLNHGDADYWFCAPGCRASFAKELVAAAKL